MTIYYDPMDEAWIDDNDPKFSVGMTPEGGEPSEEFESQEAFWSWYNQGETT